MDWLGSKLRVERDIVRQRVGDVKTIYSGRMMSIDAEMLAALKGWKETTEFSSEKRTSNLSQFSCPIVLRSSQKAEPQTRMPHPVASPRSERFAGNCSSCERSENPV